MDGSGNDPSALYPVTWPVDVLVQIPLTDNAWSMLNAESAVVLETTRVSTRFLSRYVVR